MNMKNHIETLVIGAGGIGSYLAETVHKLEEHNQFRTPSVGFTISDDDTIEDKNLPYQNFEEEELLDYKSLAIETKYPTFKGINEKIVKKSQLEGYDLIVICVDNGPTRKLVFEHCCTNKDTYFIDLRSEGQSVHAMTSDGNFSKKDLLKTINDQEEGSCQLKYELDRGIIQLGNRIIAQIGAQMILNYTRNEINVDTFTHRF
tara:strand:- start:145 stop:753 length:609 start_codon:yes stop_codon:yes gene_type:complete